MKLYKPKQSARNFEVSLNVDPRKIKLVAGSYRNLIKDSEFYSLLSKIKKYRIPLLNAWNDQKINSKDVISQMKLIDNLNS